MYLNIAAYHFHPVADPHRLADVLRECAEQQALLGTVLVAPEGINAFLVGAEAAIEAWLAVLRGQGGFADVAVKRSYSRRAPFARLKVKCKPEIITFRHEQTSPLHERAPEVSPRDLARWIAQGCDDEGRPLRLLDTRNREEFAHGTFEHALTLPIDKFTDLPAAVEAERESLQGATVVGFCTGGIRCEKAVRWLQQAGFEHAYQLQGGILGYFEQVGGFGYSGRCFVFDERVALDSQLRPLVDAEVASQS